MPIPWKAFCAHELRGNDALEKVRGRSAPHLLVLQVADFAYAACGPQIFILRVSGIEDGKIWSGTWMRVRERIVG
jgi:hypothetical protein